MFLLFRPYIYYIVQTRLTRTSTNRCIYTSLHVSNGIDSDNNYSIDTLCFERLVVDTLSRSLLSLSINEALIGLDVTRIHTNSRNTETRRSRAQTDTACCVKIRI